MPLLVRSCAGLVYNTFDGEGFPSCYNVTEVHNATSVDEMVSLVKDAAADGVRVRAAAKVSATKTPLYPTFHAQI